MSSRRTRLSLERDMSSFLMVAAGYFKEFALTFCEATRFICLK